MESFSEAAQWAKYTKGWKGEAPNFNKLNLPQPIRFVQGWPAEVTAKMTRGLNAVPSGKVLDTWNNRR